MDSIYVVPTYLVYLALSVGLTVWVANTLRKNGRQFLIDAFGGDKELADSVNHLLVVGFYLINFGYVCLMLKMGIYPAGIAGSIEVLSTKMGVVLLLLGIMHFFNLAILSIMRKVGRRESLA